MKHVLGAARARVAERPGRTGQSGAGSTGAVGTAALAGARTGYPELLGGLDWWAAVVASLAVAVSGAGLALGWRGVDLPAQLYRVQMFRTHGFALWDSQWFGGHWLLDYSVLFPAVASVAGVPALTVASAALASLAFDRLLVAHFDRRSRLAASVAFVLGTTVQSSIGQLTFLLGEAAALWCLVAIVRRRWVAACLLGAGAALTSPLDGAFVVLAVAAFSLGQCRTPGGWQWRGAGEAGLSRTSAVAACVVAPIVAMSALFPGQGSMPYPLVDYVWEMAVAAVVLVACQPQDRLLRTGAVLYMAAMTASVVIPSPLGGNVGRLEDTVALPLAIALLLADRRGRGSSAGVNRWGALTRATRVRQVALVGLLGPLVLSQWGPAWDAMTANNSKAWTHQAYYQPLVAWLRGHGEPLGRVEVVPTADHWEANYVAPSVALARGWERQLDRADNPIFYQAEPLTGATYRQWLLDNGVRYVALANAPLDTAGKAEGRLVAAGTSGLRKVWHFGGWTVYAVEGSTGIGGPGADVLSVNGSRIELRLTGPAVDAIVRIRFSPAWRVLSGAAAVSEAPGRWLAVTATGPVPCEVSLGLDPLG